MPARGFDGRARRYGSAQYALRIGPHPSSAVNGAAVYPDFPCAQVSVSLCLAAAPPLRREIWNSSISTPRFFALSNGDSQLSIEFDLPPPCIRQKFRETSASLPVRGRDLLSRGALHATRTSARPSLRHKAAACRAELLKCNCPRNEPLWQFKIQRKIRFQFADFSPHDVNVYHSVLSEPYDALILRGHRSPRPGRGEERPQVAHQAGTLPRLRKRGKKAFRPMFDIMDQEMLEHGAVAFAPLGQRHFQCALQRRCHGLAIVRIDDQRPGEFRSRAGE